MLTLLGILLGGVSIYRKKHEPKVMSPSQKFIADLNQYTNDAKGREQATTKYSETYNQSLTNIKGFSPAKWNKAQIDSAYQALLYADKIGAYGQVQSILALLQAAKSGGINIDDNSYGVDQKKRDEILARAENLAKISPIQGAGIKN